jgi:hypothetical protein
VFVAPRSSGRAVKNASLFDGGRSNKFTQTERAWTVDCPRSGFLLLLRLLGSEVSFALIVRCAFWFCTLVIEGSALKLPQAFRERLDPKLSSLAFYPKNCEVISLPTIMNYEL